MHSKLYNMSTITKNAIDFKLANKVKDMSLAEWGRKEIMLAEAEMPGLMSIRKEYGPSQPLCCLTSSAMVRKWERFV